MDPIVEKTDIAWLAGLFDGEGTVFLGKQGNIYSPDIRIKMTHKITIDRAIAVCKNLGIQSLNYDTKSKNELHKDTYTFEIGRSLDVLKFCRYIRPYTTTKSNQLDLMIEFVERRISGLLVPDSGTFQGMKLNPLTSEDHAIYSKLKRQNKRGPSGDPIDNVKWYEASKLTANAWNPNVVMTPELKLLEISLLTDGWTQAVIINPNFVIIDGFHRWRLAQDSKPLLAKYGTLVPCVTVPVSDPEAMMMTVRMIRAKGTAAAIPMSHIVQSLIEDYAVSYDDIQHGLGITKAELDLLAAGSLFKNRKLDRYKYSRAWEPIEVSHAERKRMIEQGLAAADIEAEREDDPEEVVEVIPNG